MQVVYGGAPKRGQIAKICNQRGLPCHMIVGTPGRLNDLVGMYVAVYVGMYVAVYVGMYVTG